MLLNFKTRVGSIDELGQRLVGYAELSIVVCTWQNIIPVAAEQARHLHYYRWHGIV